MVLCITYQLVRLVHPPLAPIHILEVSHGQNYVFFAKCPFGEVITLKIFGAIGTIWADISKKTIKVF